MRKSYTLLVLSVVVILNNPLHLFAQTGPAGVGSSTNNQLWLDASDLTLANNTLFYDWPDRSGNNRVASAQYPTTRPLLLTGQINGLNAVDFDGANDFLRVGAMSAFSANPNATFIFVQRNDNLTQTGVYFTNSFGTNSGNFQAHLHGGLISGSGGLHRSFSRTGSGSIMFSAHNASTSYQINSTTINSGAIRTFTDGTNIGNNVVSLATPISHRFFFLGVRPYLNDLPYNGKIAEVLAFSTELGTAERTIVENYLSTKYNLAISNDKYAHEGTGHTFEMAGIGQENGNTNADAQGAGIVRMNNASAFANNTYLLWAHNNTAFTAQFSNKPNTYPILTGASLTRTWRVGKTNDLGTVTVEIDLTGIEFGDPTSYELLIDADGDFTTGAVRHTTGFTYNAGVITFTDVNFTDGDFFTIGNPNGDIISVTTGPWSNQTTWNCTCVPDNTVSATIDDGDNVTVDVASSINTLTINSTGTLSFSGSSTLTIEEDLAIAGSINGAGGTILFAGTTAQSISGTGSATYNNLTLNNAAGLIFTGGTHSITGALTVTNGNFNVNGQPFTMVSDATATARIAQLGAGGSISGTFIIQRFIGARADGYSDMSSSVQSATFADWADDFAILFAPYVPGVSTPSAWGYSESAWDYYAIESATDDLIPGEGYEIYLDNDGSTGTSWSATQLELTGVPNTGNIDIGVTVDNDGWNLVGNPYASFISWTNFRSTAGVAMNTQFMFYDETIGDFGVGNLGAVLASGQGFWIECTAAGIAQFRETNKTTNTASSFRNTKEVLFGLRLQSENINSFSSNTYFRFEDGASTSFEVDRDLSFMKVPHKDAPALYSYSEEGRKLRINELSANEEMNIPISFNVGICGYYIIGAQEIDQLIEENGFTCIYLEDTKTGKMIDLSQGNYHFYADVNEKSERFVLRLSKNGSSCRMAQDAAFTIAEPSGVEIIKNANGVFVNFQLEELQNAVITVINPLGQQLINPIAQQFKEQNVRVYLPADYQGIFLITVQVGDKRITRKFFN